MPGFGILALCGYGALRGGATGGPLRWLWRRRNGFLYGPSPVPCDVMQRRSRLLG